MEKKSFGVTIYTLQLPTYIVFKVIIIKDCVHTTKSY